MIPNKVYDVLKWVVVIFMPALNALIYALGHALGFDSTVICEVITAIQIFIGALIGVSTISYNKEKNNGENTDKTV